MGDDLDFLLGMVGNDISGQCRLAEGLRVAYLSASGIRKRPKRAAWVGSRQYNEVYL